jgi:uncharacterized protein
MKFLFWAGIGVVIVMWLLRSKKAPPRTQAFRPQNAANADKVIEPIIQCAYCGMHVPASEAVTTSSGVVFCSEEHRLRHVGS